MHVIEFAEPSPAVAQYVDRYARRTTSLGGSSLLHPIHARSTPAIEFTFAGAYQVRTICGASVEMAPSTVVVGVQTYRRVELIVTGSIDAFAIFFRPGGLQRLFPVDAPELTDWDYDARAVLGPEIASLHQRLGECRSFSERIQVANDFLVRKILSTECGVSGMSQAARHLTDRNGTCTVEELACLTGFSPRHFKRLFRRETGVPPKLYARIVRFEVAVRIKAACPQRSWIEVAHELGYHDQMHMIHDFRRLAGDTPANVLSMTERVFSSFGPAPVMK